MQNFYQQNSFTNSKNLNNMNRSIMSFNSNSITPSYPNSFNTNNNSTINTVVDNNNINNNNNSNNSGLPASYLNFIATNLSNNQDFLNSSQTEKNWLNSSLNDKNWLNNSLNLPPELRYNFNTQVLLNFFYLFVYSIVSIRYQSLDEMVGKIIEDESLLASTNALNFSFKSINGRQQMQFQHHTQHQQQQQLLLNQSLSKNFLKQNLEKYY
jgi:hypothetical protein